MSVLSPILRELLGPLLEIRVFDVIDILLVTALVYAGIVWIRRTQAALVATGMLILGVLYVAARAGGLLLTAWIFQGFFAIFVVIIVVIFQEELRQLFERLAVFGLRRGDKLPDPQGPTDLIVQCMADFGRERIGALVVLPGRQPLTRYIQGGIELHGRLSMPLLKSIFDPHSPGHDGAVILEDGTVSRFATHLPLSKDLRQTAHVGTRHAAALGLAELSDALCIVVSEERGEISVAQEGRLRRLDSPQELGRMIEGSLIARRPAKSRRARFGTIVRENWREMVVSLVLVLGLWYLLVPGARLREQTFDVPVRVTNIPSGHKLREVSPKEIRVALSAPSREFYLFDSGRLEVLIDASIARLGRRTFRISEDNLEIPRQFVVQEIEPSKVKIDLESSGTTKESASGESK